MTVHVQILYYSISMQGDENEIYIYLHELQTFKIDTSRQHYDLCTEVSPRNISISKYIAIWGFYFHEKHMSIEVSLQSSTVTSFV